MSIPETVLVFVGAPALIMAAITLLVLGPSELHKPTRYRPGRPWPHKPAWYLPHEIAAAPQDERPHGAALALPDGRKPATRNPTAVGGASGEW
jgi:hypothetical protein